MSKLHNLQGLVRNGVANTYVHPVYWARFTVDGDYDDDWLAKEPTVHGHYWLSGYDSDDRFIIVAYVTGETEIERCWPNLYEVRSIEYCPEGIKTNERFS